MLGCLKNLPLQESKDWVIWNRYRNGPRIVVDLMIEKKDNPIADELALLALG